MALKAQEHGSGLAALNLSYTTGYWAVAGPDSHTLLGTMGAASSRDEMEISC